MRTDADGNREHTDQREQQREGRGGDPDRARPRRPGPGQREAGEEEDRDRTLGDGGLPVRVPADEDAEVGQPRDDEADTLGEQEEPNRLPHGVYLLRARSPG